MQDDIFIEKNLFFCIFEVLTASPVDIIMNVFLKENYIEEAFGVCGDGSDF